MYWHKTALVDTDQAKRGKAKTLAEPPVDYC